MLLAERENSFRNFPPAPIVSKVEWKDELATTSFFDLRHAIINPIMTLVIRAENRLKEMATSGLNSKVSRQNFATNVIIK
jgi:hypothetical protein